LSSHRPGLERSREPIRVLIAYSQRGSEQFYGRAEVEDPSKEEEARRKEATSN
jgi:hypothetical protein